MSYSNHQDHKVPLSFVCQRSLRLFVYLCLAFFVASCTHHKKKKTLVESLHDCGVQFVQLGETMRLILPSHTLFYANSANIQPSYAQVLKNVARLLRRYEKVSVTVRAYTNPKVDYKYSRAISRQQANNIVTYLWRAGVDARVMYGVGHVRTCPKGCTERRVEISFRYFPHYLGL